MGIVLLLFIIMPIVEMVVLIKVGTLIGAMNTVGLVLLTAIVGAALLRHQGLATLLKANQRLNSGQLPAREVAEGLILAVGGALLLTPGFVTDLVGFFFLLPGSRQWLAGRVLKRMLVPGQARGFHFSATSGGAFTGGRDEDGNIIEGDYREEPPRDRDSIEKK